MANCICREPNCWDDHDYSWLSSESGWHGDINGTRASVFFIHGKRIREQRHIPTGYFPLGDLPALLARWGDGLPNARLVWLEDTGGGDAGLWIEGERVPNDADLSRLAEVRERIERDERRTLARLTAKYDAPSPV